MEPGGGIRLYDDVSKKYEIIGFTDNDSNKIGKRINTAKVYSLSDALQLSWDKIIITSAPGLDSAVYGIQRSLFCF